MTRPEPDFYLDGGVTPCWNQPAIDALTARVAELEAALNARVTMSDAPDWLNSNDKAFWVLGWNERSDRAALLAKEK